MKNFLLIYLTYNDFYYCPDFGSLYIIREYTNKFLLCL